jgi:hypothetical protein
VGGDSHKSRWCKCHGLPSFSLKYYLLKECARPGVFSKQEQIGSEIDMLMATWESRLEIRGFCIVADLRRTFLLSVSS